MAVKTGCGLTVALTLGLLTAGEALAGPFFGPPSFCDPCWPGPGTYSALHYWAPGIYRYRAFHSVPPINMYADQGCSNVPYGYLTNAYPCPYTTPPNLYTQPRISYYNGAQGPLTELQTTPQARQQAAPPAAPPPSGQP